MSRLGKPLLMLLLFGLPLGLLWVILSWFAGAFGSAGMSGIFLALWLVAGGVALWVGFAREGYAGDFTSTDWGAPDSALPSLLLRGALFGLGLFGLLQWAMPGPLDDLLNRLQALGTFHRGTFAFIAGNYLLRMAGVGFAAGTLLYLLGQANLAVGRRVVLLVLPLVGVGIAVLPQRAVAPSRLAARLDITPQVLRAIPNRWTPRMPSAGTPDGAAAAQELAQRVHLGLVSGAQTRRPERSLLLFHGDHTYDLRQSLVSEDGFPLDVAARERVRAFLQQRDYWTALSGVAIKQLLDASVTDFDPTAALDVCLQDETHYPHLARIQHTQQALFFVSSASPQNRSLLDRFADDHLFAYPDRESLRMMGDLYNRIGAIPQAEAWYHRAEMPRSFFAMIHQYPVFHQGRISGRLLLNGRPLTGVRVGLLPKRLNGLPRDMQGLILSVDQEFLGIAQTGPAPFSPFHPRPYAFRWLSAGVTTDAQGAFALPDLIEGQYFLVVALPSNLQLAPPVDPALQLRNAPGPVVLSAAQPAADLGTISLSYLPGKR